MGTSEKLSQQIKGLQQILYPISHDIKEPIANLKGLMSLIELEGMSAGNTEIIEKLNKTINSLDITIKDLTHLIDIQNSTEKIYQRVYLQKEIDQIDSLLKRQIEESGVSIKTTFSKEEYIYSVPPILRSILYNLVSNSIKYKSQKRPLKISVWTERTDNLVKIYVKDNGAGINLNVYKHMLFKLHTQFKKTSMASSGIGLFIVKLQIDILEGEIDVDSKLDEGTCFKILTPKPKHLEKQLILENKSGGLYYDAYLTCLKTSWKEKIFQEDFTEIVQKIKAISESYQVFFWIFNIDSAFNQHLSFLEKNSVLNNQNCFSSINNPLQHLILLIPEQRNHKTTLEQIKKNNISMLNLNILCMTSLEETNKYINNIKQLNITNI